MKTTKHSICKPSSRQDSVEKRGRLAAQSVNSLLSKEQMQALSRTLQVPVNTSNKTWIRSRRRKLSAAALCSYLKLNEIALIITTLRRLRWIQVSKTYSTMARLTPLPIPFVNELIRLATLSWRRLRLRTIRRWHSVRTHQDSIKSL